MPARKRIAFAGRPRLPALPISKAGRIGFCIVAVFSLAANHCPLHDDKRPAAQEESPPPGEPETGQPSSPSSSVCWEGLPDFDESAGCYRVSFEASAGDLEIYSAAMTLPEGVTFEGFSAAGPDPAVIGTFGLDVDRDGEADRSVRLISLNDDWAYADLIEDEIYSPALEPELGRVERGALLLRLPFGGDANVETLTVPAPFAITLRLREEILTTSGALGTRFTVGGDLTSVDPDTDDYDDGTGAAPAVTPFTADVEVVPPAQP